MLGGERWILSHRLVEMEAVPPFLTPWWLGAVEILHRLRECSGAGDELSRRCFADVLAFVWEPISAGIPR